MYTSDYIYVYLLLLFLLFVFPLTRTDRCWLRTFFSPRFLTRSLSVLHLTWRALTAESCQPFPSNGRILVLGSPDSGFGTSILVASCGPWSAVSCPPILRDRVCLDRGPDARTVVVSGLLDSWVNWTPLRNIFSKIFEWAEMKKKEETTRKKELQSDEALIVPVLVLRFLSFLRTQFLAL